MTRRKYNLSVSWPFPDRYVTAEPPRWRWWHTALLLALAGGGVLLWACGQ